MAWGVQNLISAQVSLGSSCEFRYGDEIVELRSGDALFGNFGSVARRVEIKCPARLRYYLISTGRTRGRVDASGGDGPGLVAAPARGTGFGGRDLALRPRALQPTDSPGARSTACVVGLTQPPCDALSRNAPLPI